jgi:fructose-1,6-bisphosphatase-3
MSEAYQVVTGIAGYTLIGNSHELVLAAHGPFSETDALLRQGLDVTPQTEQIVAFPHRLLIADTDTGQLLREQLDDLHKRCEFCLFFEQVAPRLQTGYNEAVHARR